MKTAPTFSRREQNKSEQRERILDAARSLFGERGVDAVTVADVAAAADVSRATVFNYFPSKYALIEAITDDVVAYFEQMLEAALADEVTPTPALVRALYERMGEGIETYAGFFRGVFREIMKISVGLDEGAAARRTREVISRLLLRLMERGLERRELNPVAPAADLARAFDGLANGTINHWLFDEQSDSLRERMAHAAEILLGAVAAKPFAAKPRRLVALAAPPLDPTYSPEVTRKRPRRAPRGARKEKR